MKLKVVALCVLAVVLVSCGGKPSAKHAEKTMTVATVQKKGTGVALNVIRGSEWASVHPEIYASYMRNAENSEAHPYPVEYPMIPVIYEGSPFAKSYESARGHVYTVSDAIASGRPHPLANCFSCKTPHFSVMVLEHGDAAYSFAFGDVQAQNPESVTCYSCHANEPGTNFVISNSFLPEALGSDVEKIPAQSLVCAQCHVEYYFQGEYKATTLPYSGLQGISPEAILAHYNDIDFADYVNPRTGVRQIKVQHPEFETFYGEGSVHAKDFTCADCHMGNDTAANGKVFKSHFWRSPLQNEQLIAETCSKCHTGDRDLNTWVGGIIDRIDGRTHEVGYVLQDLTERLVPVVANNLLGEAELAKVRSLARDAQFYWDFVMVENSEGAHNSRLMGRCLDKAEALAKEAMAMLPATVAMK